MLAASLIAKKRDGKRLSREEIEYFVDGFTKDKIHDYQMSALAMAICIRGMDAEETAALTRAMLESGERLPRSEGEPPRLDKHSSGGLGDKVSLILAPLLAAAGMHVPMISGRGLGLTGGTLDKLESIPGFHVDFEMSETTRLLRQAGCCIISASDQVAPADKRLYGLRDVTATVESVGLITASILSKKLAASLDALVMDVKVGSAAFMKNAGEARALAQSLVSTGVAAGLPVKALLSDMDQPLGRAVGNAIEVNESVEVLKGAGPKEVRELTVELAAHAIASVRPDEPLQAIQDELASLLDSGRAMEKFEKMLEAQGGSLLGPLELAPATAIFARESGYLTSIDCPVLGETIVSLGGGRRTASDKIVHQVGLSIEARIGDVIDRLRPIAILHAPKDRATHYADKISQAFQITDSPISARPLVIEVVG